MQLQTVAYARRTGRLQLARTVTLIRHAETNANRVGRWQGSADSGISPEGEDQLLALGNRNRAADPEVLVASDLPRTMRTASVLGTPAPDPAWREFGVGEWEGLNSAEINEQFPGQMAAFLRGEAVAPGGGENMADFRERVIEAFDSVVASIDDDGDAVVVTHAGVIWAVTTHALGLTWGSIRMVPSHNTALTRIRVEADGTTQVSVFNDASHLTVRPTMFGSEGTTISLFRHGQTEGNAAGVWQGSEDSRLTLLGRQQVKAASVTAPLMQSIFTSPLGRAIESAEILAEAVGEPPVEVEGLAEMSFGAWENKTPDEAKAQDPELFHRIYGEGHDLARGGSGETYTDAGERFAVAIDALTDSTENSHIGVVSHGAVLRSYVTRVMGLTWATRDRFPVPRNSSMSQIRVTASGPVLSAYNVAPHLV